MKRTSFFMIIISVVFVLGSCKKGDTGPAGPDGNANVIVYNFGARTFTGVTSYILPGLTTSRVDSSLYLAYYNPSTESSTAWYSVPGLGSGAAYDTRSLLFLNGSQYEMTVRTVLPGGSGSYPNAVTFTKTRIFLIPASQILQGGRGSTVQVDYNDYYSVCRYYGIPE